MTFPLYFASWPGQAVPDGLYAACGYCVGALGSLQCPEPIPRTPDLIVFHDCTPMKAEQLPTLAAELLRAMSDTGAGGIVCDLERTAQEQAAQLAEHLAAGLSAGQMLIFPEALACPACRAQIISYDPIRETFSQLLRRAKSSHLVCWLELAPIHLLLPLPVPGNFDAQYHPEELAQLRRRQQAPSFYSEELCCNYFSFLEHDTLYLGLYDTPQTLQRRLKLAQTTCSAAIGLTQELLPWQQAIRTMPAAAAHTISPFAPGLL